MREIDLDFYAKESYAGDFVLLSHNRRRKMVVVLYWTIGVTDVNVHADILQNLLLIIL